MATADRHPMRGGAPQVFGASHPLACQCCYPGDPLGPMQPHDGYGSIPMDLHVSAQGYHPYYSILEMRKEKSRDAARSRRGKENYEFYELAKLLPLPAAITTQLDKASIIRLSISYLKLRDFTAHGDPPWQREAPPKPIKGSSMRSRSGSTVAMDIFEQHQGTHILQSLDGFAFALSADGRFLYISETVSIYLGLSQVEMTGSSVFDYIHQQDHAELAEQLGINLSQPPPSSTSSSAMAASPASSDDSSSAPSSTPADRALPVMQLNGNTPYKGMDRSFCIRMKSTLTKRGCHFKSSGYRVVLVLSHLRPQYVFPPGGGRGSKGGSSAGVSVLGMVAMAIALPPPSINEVRLESDMFVTRLSFEFRVAHCEPRVSELLDYTADELTGKNMYTLCYGQDVQKLRKCHIDLINKGQVMSGYYRLINKNGGYTWLQTCATVICNSKNSDEQSIICVNYVLSGAEYENCILDCMQMPNSGNLKPDDPSNSERGSSPDHTDPREESSRDGCCSPKPDGRCSASSEHLSQMVKHSAEHALRTERCPLPEPPSNGYEHLEGKQAMDMAPYQQEGESRAAKKRRLLERKSPSPRTTPSPDKGAIDRPWKRSPRAYASAAPAVSVKELEDVMNKHLPAEESCKRSTIQWIGGAPPQTTLPASSLLRQIYVNRESVIRSGSHARGAWDASPQGGPTPPSGDPPYEQAGSYGVIASYPPGYMDSYSAAMTPPASVSPRDKFHPEFTEAAAAAAAAAMPHMHHYEPPPPLPLKPQVFVHPGSLDYTSEQQLYASGFHLYHGGGKAGHHHSANGSHQWYPQPNT